jgi:hypothetical protein
MICDPNMVRLWDTKPGDILSIDLKETFTLGEYCDGEVTCIWGDGTHNLASPCTLAYKVTPTERGDISMHNGTPVYLGSNYYLVQSPGVLIDCNGKTVTCNPNMVTIGNVGYYTYDLIESFQPSGKENPFTLAYRVAPPNTPPDTPVIDRKGFTTYSKSVYPATINYFPVIESLKQGDRIVPDSIVSNYRDDRFVYCIAANGNIVPVARGTVVERKHL